MVGLNMLHCFLDIFVKNLCMKISLSFTGTIPEFKFVVGIEIEKCSKMFSERENL